MVGVEATHEVLVGLAAARVLDHHQAGGDPQDVLHAGDGTQIEGAFLHGKRGGGADRPRTKHQRGLIGRRFVHRLGCGFFASRIPRRQVGKADETGRTNWPWRRLGMPFRVAGSKQEIAGPLASAASSKPCPARRRHLGVDHVPVGVQVQFQANRALLPSGQGRRRIGRLNPRLEQGWGKNPAGASRHRAPHLRLGRTRCGGEPGQQKRGRRTASETWETDSMKSKSVLRIS